MRWVIELHRLLPGGWVTLLDVYRCTIGAELFAKKIGEARKLAARLCSVRVTIASKAADTRCACDYVGSGNRWPAPSRFLPNPGIGRA